MDGLNQILQLPERCLVNRKITKAFFKRNFDLTLTEKKLLDDASIILSIEWIASLKPDQINVNAYSKEQLVFEEVQVISLSAGETNFEKNKQKIIDLVQKFIPYHIVLCISNGKEFILNACIKRINQNDATRRTIDKCMTSENIPVSNPSEVQSAFLKSLAFDKLDKHNLKSLYDSYCACIVALQAAEQTGKFSLRTKERSKEDVLRLEKIMKLENEIIVLQNQAIKETQLSVQVNLNAEVQARRGEIGQLKRMLEID